MLSKKVPQENVHRSLHKLFSVTISHPFSSDRRLSIALDGKHSDAPYSELQFRLYKKVSWSSFMLRVYRQFFGFGKPAILAMSIAGC